MEGMFLTNCAASYQQVAAVLMHKKLIVTVICNNIYDT